MRMPGHHMLLLPSIAWGAAVAGSRKPLSMAVETVAVDKDGAERPQLALGAFKNNVGSNYSNHATGTEQHHNELDLDLDASQQMKEMLSSITNSLLAPHGKEPGVSQVVRTVVSKMDLATATKTVGKKSLPTDVAVLIKTVTEGRSSQPFDEMALEKAQCVLNEMVEKSWRELDDKIIECKEFEETNRGTFDQVVTDISRLVEQTSDLSRIETEAMEGVASKEQELGTVEASMQDERKMYQQIFLSNTAELQIRQNDLNVFQFILEFTKCADATAFLQGSSLPRVCQMKGGQHALHFDDKDVQAKYEKKLTDASRRTVSQILGEVQAEHTINEAKRVKGADHVAMSFVQQYPPMNTTMPVPPDVEPVVGSEGNACLSSGGAECMKSCPPTPPDCGLLYDKLSMLWGDYKDKVDALQMEMNKNEFEFEELKMSLNDQIRVMTTSKARFAMQLAEARSNLAADREEKKNKELQKSNLERDYVRFLQECKKRIMWIMYQDMCSMVVVRNAVLETSTVCPTASITDCDVDAWIPEECSMACDDECPDPTDPYACGGWQTITRKIVVAPNSCGIACPDLSRSKKCSQVKCPVNCEMSEWSGWSKCTADCEGGVEGHTRSVLRKPRNGGTSCNTVEETRPCATGSCDRDCSIADWTDYNPCSVACGGGFHERFRHVLVPTRGFGKCPRKTSAFRYMKEACNEQECTGDEVCVAKQDLIFAIDGSGSLTEDGFGTLKTFALTLVAKYKGHYFGATAMRIGVLLFGNGVIMQDGNISPAINAQPITDDLEMVKEMIEVLPFKKGFTNMAQAFALAEVMYTQASRGSAQSAILVISDGRPSMAFQTREVVEQLDDKNVQRFFVVVSDDAGAQLDQMKRWASSPWETNLLHVPGLMPLHADQDMWAQRALTMFCPLSFSPADLRAREQTLGYMHVKESGYCGDRLQILSDQVEGAADCATLAEGAGKTAFLLGTWFRRGYCYASGFEVSQAIFAEWSANRVEPTCSSGWVESQIFDFYAVRPNIPIM